MNPSPFYPGKTSYGGSSAIARRLAVSKRTSFFNTAPASSNAQVEGNTRAVPVIKVTIEKPKSNHLNLSYATRAILDNIEKISASSDVQPKPITRELPLKSSTSFVGRFKGANKTTNAPYPSIGFYKRPFRRDEIKPSPVLKPLLVPKRALGLAVETTQAPPPSASSTMSMSIMSPPTKSPRTTSPPAKSPSAPPPLTKSPLAMSPPTVPPTMSLPATTLSDKPSPIKASPVKMTPFAMPPVTMPLITKPSVTMPLVTKPQITKPPLTIPQTLVKLPPITLKSKMGLSYPRKRYPPHAMNLPRSNQEFSLARPTSRKIKTKYWDCDLCMAKNAKNESTCHVCGSMQKEHKTGLELEHLYNGYQFKRLRKETSAPVEAPKPAPIFEFGFSKPNEVKFGLPPQDNPAPIGVPATGLTPSSFAFATQPAPSPLGQPAGASIDNNPIAGGLDTQKPLSTTFNFGAKPAEFKFEAPAPNKPAVTALQAPSTFTFGSQTKPFAAPSAASDPAKPVSEAPKPAEFKFEAPAPNKPAVTALQAPSPFTFGSQTKPFAATSAASDPAKPVSEAPKPAPIFEFGFSKPNEFKFGLPPQDNPAPIGVPAAGLTPSPFAFATQTAPSPFGQPAGASIDNNPFAPPPSRKIIRGHRRLQR